MSNRRCDQYLLPSGVNLAIKTASAAVSEYGRRYRTTVLSSDPAGLRFGNRWRSAAAARAISAATNRHKGGRIQFWHPAAETVKNVNVLRCMPDGGSGPVRPGGKAETGDFVSCYD